jgi:membrane dipeptidase
MSAPRLQYLDNRSHPEDWARRLGISREAVDVYLSSDVIDLHTDSFIWSRLGYDLSRRHRSRLRGTPFYNQVDFPRAREAALGGVVWSITTNPFRTARGRRRTFLRNLARLRELIEQHPDELRVVRSRSDYEEAKAQGLLACWVGVQGGNALDESLDALHAIPDDLITRITLVHFTRSRIGLSSANTRRPNAGLSPFGRDFVASLVERRILVDLAHINRGGFFDALQVMPADVPCVVSHTGVKAERDVFRNLDDDQLRAVAERGGTVGIMYQANFIDDTWYDYGLSRIVDHMQHVVRVAGEDHVSLGSDWDGMIILPRDMRDVTELPRLVEEMLRRGWTPTRVQKILGGNYLRVLGAVRP